MEYMEYEWMRNFELELREPERIWFDSDYDWTFAHMRWLDKRWEAFKKSNGMD